jgi:hypothetical protein
MNTRTGNWLAVLLVAAIVTAPALAAEVRYEAHFPDLPGYVTLKCDLHMHTVFSDGLVWPTVRVAEMWRQGFDAMAITDHIEYQPHKKEVPTQHNRPYELAKGAAEAHNLLLIRGTEITRDTPPGHFNALFLGDVAPLDTADFVEAVRQANVQGAFVFWNHQGWKGPEKGRWQDVHTTLFENKWFQGMEICNDDDYYPEAHRLCMEKNFTMLCNSDIHEPDLRKKSSSEDHRNMNLVFAKDRTPEAIKEALFARRTVVWFKDQLIGRKEYLEPLFQRCVEVVPPRVWPGKTQRNAWIELRNVCQADIQLERPGEWRPEKLVLPARSTTLVRVPITPGAKRVELKYTAKNFLIAPDTPLEVTLVIAKP